VSDNGHVSRVMQVKLSVAKEVANMGIRSAVWAGSGLLAAATHEKMVRLLDLGSDESYNLSLSAIGDVDRTDRVVCVAFSPVDRYLAVGTQMGIVAVWKYCAAFKKKSNEDDSGGIGQTDWEVCIDIPTMISILCILTVILLYRLCLRSCTTRLR
jgi:WD40 repeat protein